MFQGHANVRLFSTDLDGTLLGAPEAAMRFTERWTALEPTRRPLLVYNTGRTVADTRELVASRQLPDPDFIIGGVGTDLHDALYNSGMEYRARIEAGWNRALVEHIVGGVAGITRQPGERSPGCKSSWYWTRALPDQVEQLRAQLRAAGVAAAVIYSCRYFLDVIPAHAGKGNALRWLCERLHVPLAHVLVAGDTANDTDMFLLPGVRGIAVGNALPELISAVDKRSAYFARQPMADGVAEGLAHFGVFTLAASAALV